MMNRKTCNEDLITEVFIDINKDGLRDKSITKKTIEDVVMNGQYKFVAEKIKAGMFEDIMIKYFGKFKAKHKMIQKMYSKLVTKKTII